MDVFVLKNFGPLTFRTTHKLIYKHLSQTHLLSLQKYKKCTWADKIEATEVNILRSFALFDLQHL